MRTTPAPSDRFRLSRGGILNVWQYDDQVFAFAGGRLLLRGANGAGKSKTLEMLLPFVLDGDKARMTASGRHHTSLLWLMTDGYAGASRTGYLWVEFTRVDESGQTHSITCGVGLRASDSARQATAWFFTCPRRVGVDLHLEDESGPLSAQRCRDAVEPDGHFFDSARRYRDHVGELLFGLPPDQYAELLRLLYWLRQPQVGEDIEPRRLADQLVQALPQVDDDAVRAAGDTFDELEAFGEQIDRRDRAATAVAEFVGVYAGYARGVVRERGRALLDAEDLTRRERSALRRAERALEQAETEAASTRTELGVVDAAEESARGRLGELEKGPEARAQQRLDDLSRRVDELQDAASRAGDVAERADRRLAESRTRAERSRAEVADRGRALHREAVATAEQLAGVGAPPVGVPAGLTGGEPARTGAEAARAGAELGESGAADGGPEEVRQATERLGADIAAVRPALGELTAALLVVDAARVDAERARDAVAAAEDRVAEAEERAEGARRRRDEARECSRETETDFGQRLEAWRGAAHAVPLTLPELTAEALAGLEGAVQRAAAPVRRRAEEALGSAVATVAEHQHREADLRAERERVVAETDPAPPAPIWGRADRSSLSGAPLWRVVDFRDGLVAEQRAGLEAALEGAGLLDAWLHPDGRVVDPERADVVLVAASPREGVAADGVVVNGREPVGRGLADLLRADVPDGSAVPAELVEQVLAQVEVWSDRLGTGTDEVEVGTDGSRPGDRSIAVSPDGRWRAGPAVGRAVKERAQYIGATAREAERRRRLEAVDRELAAVARALAAAREARDAARSAVDGLDAWLAARPRHEQLLRAWADLDAAEGAAGQAATEHAGAEQAAAARRAEANRREQELQTLAATHRLPTTSEGLATRRARLEELTARLHRHEDRLDVLASSARDWADQLRRADDDAEEARQRHAEAEAAGVLAARASAERDELRAALGDTVAELERRMAALRAELADAGRRRRQLREALDRLQEELGRGRAEVASRRENVEGLLPRLESARTQLATLGDVPGLLAAAVPVPDDAEPAVTAAAVAQADQVVARRLVELPQETPARDTNAVLAASRELQSGPAATLEPRVVELDGVLAAVGRDDAGERPLTELAVRLRRSVDADRQLLSDRERRLFEDHVLGHLGDSLRGVRIKAEELVSAMNGLLHGVTTSQGIRVRLRWRLRDDIPVEAKRAVQLLGEPLGALLPDERRELRESLHRLIEVSRAEAPEESYAEHLARALDYRQWFAFRIQYHRPEAADWLDLHRKSPLSQGEQKVLCYLPLFAAAAAHFTSVAGAAPHAPRFVLLDDAFPKIDVRTHPLLFGLLVDLDLDFMVTSERLWGDHATVPELAIYEALRSPGERGIAQYEHRWDGHQLTAVGA